MIFHVLTIFPEFFEGPFAHGVVKRAQGRRPARHPHPQSARLDSRPPQDGGRPAVRRRRGHGAEAGADLSRRWNRSGRSATPDQKVVLLSAQGRMFDQAMANRLSARVGTAADLRPVRRRGRARGGAPGRRRDLDRRLCAERRRTGGGGGDRCGGAAAAGRAGQRELRRRSSRSRTRATAKGCSIARTGRGRRNSAAGRCRRCC